MADEEEDTNEGNASGGNDKGGNEVSSTPAGERSTLRSVYATRAIIAMIKRITRANPNDDKDVVEDGDRDADDEEERTEREVEADEGDVDWSNRSSEGMMPEMLSKPPRCCSGGGTGTIEDVVVFISSGSGRQSSGQVVRVSTTSHNPLPQRNCS